MVNFIVPKAETLAEKKAIPSFLHSLGIPLSSVYYMVEGPLLISEDTAVNQSDNWLIPWNLHCTVNKGKKRTTLKCQVM